MPAVISVSGLRKSYGELEAVGGIDLEVASGEVFAFLGPNGAGKTTTVEVLAGYRRRSGGEVSVLGEDPQAPGAGWRERFGIVLQESAPNPYLTVRETVELFAGYYSRSRPVDDTIARVGLDGERDRRVRRLSGGQRRRLDVALALVGDPELVFLDEPTAGFDPGARRDAWSLIQGLRELGTTVFLTTHYMDEAQALADRVAIIVGGRIVAHGSPSELIDARRQATRIRFSLPSGVDLAELPAGVGDIEPAERDGTVLVRAGGDPVPSLNRLTAWALEHGHELRALEVSAPTLEEVYLELTREAG